MANRNFVVHNGLTVGPLTIDATTGDITTSGNLTLAGGGSISVSNVSVGSISQGDSSIRIIDTGIGSNVSIIVDGTTEHTVDADGVNLANGDRYAIDGVSVLDSTTLGSGVLNSSLTTLGNLTNLLVTGTIQTNDSIQATGIVYGNSGLSGTILTVNQPNITTIGNLLGVSSAGTIRTIGIVYANADIVSTNILSGALRVTGGAGISGNIHAGAAVYIAGKIAATVDDATALSIALGG